MKNNDLISRSALLEEFEWLKENTGTYNHAALDEHIQRIKNAPTVDAEPVRRGWWEHLGGDEWCCSYCGSVIHTEGSWEKPTKRYCFDCGAKMRGDEDATD